MSEFYADYDAARQERVERLDALLAQLFGVDAGDFPKPADLYEATKTLGDYCIENQVQSVVLPDRSARGIWIGLDEYLRLAHPAHARPSIHFINPDALIQKRSRYHEVGLPYSAADTQMRESHNALLTTDRSAPLLIFDTCIHEGETLRAVRNYFEHLGFSDIRLGVFTEGTDGYTCTETVDFHHTTNRNMLGCYPYGESDYYLDKEPDTIYATVLRGDEVDEDVGKDIAEERRHYRALIRDEYARRNG